MTGVKLCNKFLELMAEGKTPNQIVKLLKIPEWKRYDMLGVLKASGRIIRVNVDGQFVYQVQDKTPLKELYYQSALKQYKQGNKAKKPAGKDNEKLLDRPIELNAAVPSSSTGTITLTIAQLIELVNGLKKG